MRTKKRGSNHVCEVCATNFYCTLSREKQTAAAGNRIRFCSSACYGVAKIGSGNPFWGGRHSQETRRSWSETRKWNRAKQPDALRSDLASLLNDGYTYEQIGAKLGVAARTVADYKRKLGVLRFPRTIEYARAFLRNTLRACEECGWRDEARILQVHHIVSGSGNKRSNLRLMCPNCHALIHLKTKSGPWTWSSGTK